MILEQPEPSDGTFTEWWKRFIEDLDGGNL